MTGILTLRLTASDAVPRWLTFEEPAFVRARRIAAWNASRERVDRVRSGNLPLDFKRNKILTADAVVNRAYERLQVAVGALCHGPSSTGRVVDAAAELAGCHELINGVLDDRRRGEVLDALEGGLRVILEVDEPERLDDEDAGDRLAVQVNNKLVVLIRQVA